MYNHQLDTFIKVAELGSFTKTAKEQYVSPNAILQQVNILEDSLGVKLFQRTQRGVKLTPAGELLYAEAPKLIALNQKIRDQLSVYQLNEQICVGTSPIEQCQLFYQWWNLFNAGNSATTRVYAAMITDI